MQTGKQRPAPLPAKALRHLYTDIRRQKRGDAFDRGRRLTFEVSDAQYERFRALVPHGVQRPLFNVITDAILDTVAAQGPEILATMLKPDVTVQIVCTSITEEITS